MVKESSTTTDTPRVCYDEFVELDSSSSTTARPKRQRSTALTTQAVSPCPWSRSSNSVPTGRSLLDQSTMDALLLQLRQSASPNEAILQLGRTDFPTLKPTTLDLFLLQRSNPPRPSVIEPMIQSRALIDFLLQQRHSQYRTTPFAGERKMNPYNHHSPANNTEILDLLRRSLNPDGTGL
jgi:hypothetical protein